jgi:eukaryotic-like serine/threonine-protein kinase
MERTTQADELVMSLVELALTRPEDEREAYLRSACGNNSELFAKTWSYVEWEKRMKGFLLDPLYPQAEYDYPFEPGQVLINRFRIVREIAHGGMGIVYEAMDQKLSRRVAIKCAKTRFRKQLPPEVRHAREVSHPNVCKIFEIHTASTDHGEIDFISMEFLEGETLTERFRRGPFRKAEARAIALQLCAGLAEAHRNNVIHGDLKSNNVILTTGPDRSTRAVIMDFGLAHMPDTSGASRSSAVPAGTPDYMAPELWRGTRASVASDIYALGVILWELGSGLKPSDLPVTSATLSWDERLAWKPPAGRGKWDRVVARCLDSEPTQRFHSADEVAEALGPSHTHRWFLGIAATIMLAIVSSVIAYQRAAAPLETVRLAMLPFSSAGVHSSLAGQLTRDAAQQLGKLKGNSHKAFRIIPLGESLRRKMETVEQAGTELGATHVLRGTLTVDHANVILQAYLTDTRSGVDAKEWVAEYKPGELRYAPVALAGVVTETLRLPPPAAEVNARARPDYLSGLSSLRSDKTIDAALASMTRAVAADPESPLLYAGLAEAQWFKYSATEDKLWLDRAAESVRQAEERNPDLAQVHRISGLLKYDAGWYEQAAVEYLRAIELDPDNGDAHRRLGEVYESNNQLDEAVAEFHKAIETDPQQYRNHNHLGKFHYQRANYQEAVKHFQKAVELAPDEPLTHRDLGVTYLDMGQLASAENELRLSIRLQETPIALHTLGLVLMYEGKDREAIPNFVRALSLGPVTYIPWMILGTAYRLVGLASESQRAYRRGLDLAEAEMIQNPRDGRIRAHLAYLCAQLRDWRRAESEIAQALKQSPRDAQTRFAAAITYEALGRRNDTLSVLAASPDGVLADVSRWPDVADLHKDSRFLQLLGFHSGN